ncbi:MAG: hypothetical protein AVO33_04995 [delta proteobacterium ML8_F1]|nr:MAG: hypothetical protein AVO33_04995 [delta proteobacterium ML8_F1]
MKMILVIVHDEDSHNLIRELSEKDYGVTKLSSTGGFLKMGNTTLLIGVPSEEVQGVLDIIEKTCKTHKEMVSPTPIMGDTGYVPIPMEVNVGGATVFVLDVSQHHKF